ncbi:MAG: trigger factor [Candidatus Xenobia bacterium]
MKVTVSENTPVERTMEVTVDSKKVDQAYSQAFEKMARSLNLKGFRKGKVPTQIARRYITDDGLAGTVLEGMLPRAFREALVESQLVPLSEPRWEIVSKERGRDLVFKATFEVKPQVDITDYKGVAINQARPEITDEHVENVLQDYRNGQARLASVTEDRGLQEGDIALVDYTCLHEGQPVAHGSAQNYLMELKQEAYLPGFVDNLLGLKAGQEREFEADFPEDYTNDELAGKHVTFHFKLHEIKVRQLPELDDEFAKTISDFETLAALRADMLEKMTENVQVRTRREAGSRILFQLAGQVQDTQVPQALVAYKANLIFRTLGQKLEREQMTLEQYMASQGMDKDRLFRQISAQGAFEARIELAVDSVARSENITVPASEISAQIAQSAQMHGVSPSEMEEQMRQDGTIEVVRYNLLQTKVVDFLAEHGKVSYITPEEAARLAEEEKKQAEAAAKKAEKEAQKAKKAEPAEEAEAEAAEAAEAAPAPKKAKTKAAPDEEEAAPAPKKKAAPKAKEAAEEGEAEGEAKKPKTRARKKEG